MLNPEAGSGWAPLGQPPHNLTSRKKGTVTFNTYLSLDLKERRLAWRYSQHTNRWQTAIFLRERLAEHERRGHRVLVVLWDCASWHLARDLRDWFRAHNRQVEKQGHGTKIVPLLLPIHAFWLNPVEAIIRYAKSKVLPCRQFASQADQRTALDRHWLHQNLRRASVPTPESLIAAPH